MKLKAPCECVFDCARNEVSTPGWIFCVYLFWCCLTLDEKKMLIPSSHQSSSQAFLNASLLLELQPGESILFSCRCSVIHPYEKRPGELILTSGRTAFVDSTEIDAAKEDMEPASFLRRRRKDNLVKKRRGKVELWPDETIMDLQVSRSTRFLCFMSHLQQQVRRYLLRDMALELFLIDGRTFLIAFASMEERDKIYNNLNGRNLVNRISYESDVVLQNTLLRVSITQKVRKVQFLVWSYSFDSGNAV
jgi:hypothetical protein